MQLSQAQRMAAIEAILFAAGDSVAISDLGEALQMTPIELQRVLEELALRYAASESGLQLKYINDRVQLATKGIYGELLGDVLTPVRSRNLSQSVLETLTIIAYRQPVTKGEIEAIRGVRSEYTVHTLEMLGLIEDKGRKDALGHPILYGTTEEFLRRFGLESLHQLPEISEFAEKKHEEEP